MTPGPGISRTELPQGFLAAGVNCGVRKYRPDLGVILSERDAVAVGVYTKSEAKAAPILYCQSVLPSKKVRAVITNSGQANAATGEEGVRNNLRMVRALADKLGCKPEQVLAASTGVIGFQLQIEKIEAAIPELLERAANTAEPFALAVLTTDLVPKTVHTTVKLSGGEVTIVGISKGSGMIHPNMATMLGYLLTDADLPYEWAQPILIDAVDKSFNMISVDGDTSTNDCVFLLANGASGVAVKTGEDRAQFSKALIEVSQLLSQAIARDGEGATKLIEVHVGGLPSQEIAVRAARGVTVSPLIKAAIHGNDPNWGRILARFGAEGVPAECLQKMNLEFQGIRVFEKGQPIAFDLDRARVALKTDKVRITADFHSGSHDATAWGCDLSKRYVEINGEYLT